MGAKEVVIGGIILVIAAFFIILFMSVLSTTMGVSKGAIEEAEQMRLEENDLFGYGFYIRDVHFFNRSLAEGDINNSLNICNNIQNEEIVIMIVVFNNSILPDSCDIFVDNDFIKSTNIKEISCKPRCKSPESQLAIDLSAQNFWRQHEVKLCCDNLCIKKKLMPLCMS